MTKQAKAPIRVGDKFNVGKNVWEVIETKPFGKIDLMDRQRTRFSEVSHRDMTDWQRVQS